MKINLNEKGGSVLFGTLFTTGIVCLYMGSYLTLIRSENNVTKRSQTWNMAIPVAEAGIEEALTHLQTSFPDLKTTGKWERKANNVLYKEHALSADEFYKVGIFPPSSTDGTTTPVIVSEGFVRLPLSTNFISRTIRVNTKLDGYTMAGMVVVTTAKMNGNKLVIDSFNSTNSAASTNGKYDESKRGDKALLATLSSATGAIDMGNADVWGKVASGYNGSAPEHGPQSVIGSANWHKSKSKGIEPGAYSDDVNLTVETPKSPFVSALMPVAQNNVTTLTTGDYAVENLSGKVVVTGKARLLVTKSFNVSSLTISNQPGTASLELYVAAPDVDLSGNGALNVQGRAANFKYFGLAANPDLNWPGNKTITAGGNGEFTAMVYAPETVMTLNGGGKSAQDFSGACLVKSVTMKGHYSFHFDESCAGEMLKGYATISWDEIGVKWNTILAKTHTVRNLW